MDFFRRLWNILKTIWNFIYTNHLAIVGTASVICLIIVLILALMIIKDIKSNSDVMSDMAYAEALHELEKESKKDSSTEDKESEDY